MNWSEHITYALAMILTHKMRSFLTTLGIIIGIISVTVMLSLGSSLNARLKEELKERANLITVRTESKEIDGVMIKSLLTNKDTMAIQKSQAALENISPELEIGQAVVYNSIKDDAQVIGVTPDYCLVNKEKIKMGRTLNNSDLQVNQKVAIVNEDFAKAFFKESNPLGKDIQIGKRFFTVVGVLKNKTSLFSAGSPKVLIPLTTGQNYFVANPEELTRITLKISDNKNINADKRELIYALLKSRGIADASKADFRLDSDMEFQEEMEKEFKVVNIFLGGIGAISLLVGGIGIMNIMLVSVSERTREIGIRKSLGAKKIDILSQFLTESVVISIIGGSLGIGLSYLIMFIINMIAKNSIIGESGTVFFVSSNAVLLAIFSSLVIGLFFGIFPAYKASKLKPIEALRFE